MAAAAFAAILGAAVQRHGEDRLTARLPTPRTAAQLTTLPSDRFLSQMSLRIFQAGLKHSIVNAKWPAFEEVFENFEPHAVRAFSDEALERLLSDSRLIRHGGKLRAVRDNAAAMLTIADEHGSFGAWIAEWPPRAIVGLWETVGKRFAQMGGNSTPYFLRMVGKDTFLLTEAVVSALQHWSVISGVPKSRRDREVVQAAFNAWQGETGRPLCHLSLILAASVDT